MSLPTGTSSVTSASGIPRRRRRSPSLSVPSGKIGSFPPKPSSGAENEGRCGIALVPFPEEAAFSQPGPRVRIRLPPAWSLVRTCGGDARPDCADVGAAGTAFDTSLLRVRLLRLCPPRPQSRRLCRQRVDEGDGEIEPLPQSLFVARWRIDEDVALHRAARHLHTFCVRPRQGPCVLVFADADEKTALRSSGDHIAVQHEAQPAEHSDFAHRAGPGENGPNALSEIFIES